MGLFPSPLPTTSREIKEEIKQERDSCWWGWPWACTREEVGRTLSGKAPFHLIHHTGIDTGPRRQLPRGERVLNKGSVHGE